VRAVRRKAGWPRAARKATLPPPILRQPAQLRDGLAGRRQQFWLRTRSGPILSGALSASFNDSDIIIPPMEYAREFPTDQGKVVLSSDLSPAPDSASAGRAVIRRGFGGDEVLVTKRDELLARIVRTIDTARIVTRAEARSG